LRPQQLVLVLKLVRYVLLAAALAQAGALSLLELAVTVTACIRGGETWVCAQFAGM
jgi:hypothetical protein